MYSAPLPKTSIRDVPPVLSVSNTVAPPCVDPLLLIKVALPAVEVSRNSVAPAYPPSKSTPLLVKAVRLPAVALLLNSSIPERAPEKLTKFCVIPELFVIPTPLMVHGKRVVILNGLAPALKTMPLTSVPTTKTPVILEVANVAVSMGPLGGPPAVQLAGLFQSPSAGLAFQVALPAKLLLAVESRSGRMAAAVRRRAHARERRGEGDAPKSDGAM